MIPHPDRNDLLARLRERLGEISTSFTGPVYRFLDPRYSRASEIFAGKGSEYSNGRWLLKGRTLLTYTSLQPETALAESLSAGRYFGFPDGNSTPILLVSGTATISPIVDLRDGYVRQRLLLGLKTILGTDWRAENLIGKEAITQALGWSLHEAGAVGFLTESAARKGGANLMVFPENLSKPSSLEITKEVEWPRK